MIVGADARISPSSDVPERKEDKIADSKKGNGNHNQSVGPPLSPPPKLADVASESPSVESFKSKYPLLDGFPGDYFSELPKQRQEAQMKPALMFFRIFIQITSIIIMQYILICR